MGESESIEGGAIPETFEKLVKSKTLLTMKLDISDDDRLTRITSLTTRRKFHYFTTDLPEGFGKAFEDIGPESIHFEYTGPDRIKYRFKTVGAEADGHQIFFPVPRQIERLQRRRLFRIETPQGTKLCFNLLGKPYELCVINISLGGSLGTVVQTDQQGPAPPFTTAEAVRDVELNMKEDPGRQPIKIKKMLIKRIKKNPETAHFEVAFEFIELSSRNEALLNDLIYHLQRQYLRKRLPLDF